MKNKKRLILVIIIILLTLGLIYFLSNNFEKSSNEIVLNEVSDNKNNKPMELVKKEENKLILKLDNGTDKVIMDIIGEGDIFPETNTSENQSEDTRIYTFDKIYNDINYYGVNVKYYVGMDNSSYYLLVNKNNGNEVSLPSQKIVISPNKRRIVSYNSDLISGFTSNGFDILNFNGNNFTLEYKLEPTDWGPSKAKWISDSEIEFEKTKLNENYDEEIAGTVKFKLLNNKWEEIK